MQALFNPKAYFYFLNVIFFRFQRFMSFLKALPLYQFFSLCMMFGMHFDNDSIPFRLRLFSDIKRYNDMLIRVYCEA